MWRLELALPGFIPCSPLQYYSSIPAKIPSRDASPSDICTSHSPSSSLPSYTLPLIGISIAERLRDRGFDTIIRSDDSSKHPKSYRQISSIDFP